MRMGIQLRWFTMSCPTGMADSTGSYQSLSIIGLLCKHLQTSLCLYNLHILYTITNCQSRGIITTVFQLRKSMQQNRSCLLATYISYNTTHLSVLSFSVKIMYLFNMSCSWSIQSIRPQRLSFLSIIYVKIQKLPPSRLSCPPRRQHITNRS